MLNKDSNDKEILDYVMPNTGTTIRDFGSISFMGMVANKINGVPSYSSTTQELLLLVKNPPIGRMGESQKVEIIRKLLSLGVEI